MASRTPVALSLGADNTVLLSAGNTLGRIGIVPSGTETQAVSPQQVESGGTAGTVGVIVLAGGALRTASDAGLRDAVVQVARLAS